MRARHPSWKSLTWGELATLEYGKAIRGYQEHAGDYPVFGTNGRIGFWDNYLCPHPGVIVGRKGAYRGIHFSDKPFFVIDTAFYLKPKGHNLDLKWAYYQLLDFDINKMDSGSAIPSTSRDAFYALEVTLPPLSTQRKIAGVLSAYDDLIENNSRRIAILEEMAQAIYREWFVNFRFPGHEKVNLINSPLGKIPEGWKVVTVEELTTHSTEGITPAQYPEEEFAHFSIPNYDKGQLPELELGATIQSNKFVVLSGCVMLSKLNPRILRIWLPEPHGDYRPVASTEFLIVSPLAPATREFLYYQFQSDDFAGRFRSCSSGTSTSHQRVKPTDFVKLKALLPPSSLIEAFTNHVGPMCRLIHNRRIHNHNLRTTRDLLLPKLISGQLDVEELDVDAGEPLVEATT